MPGQRGKRAALSIPSPLSVSACVALVALVSFVAAPEPAAAAEGGERTLQLEWTAPASCPSRDEVLERVDELLESSPVPHREVSARGHVTESASGRGKPRYRLDLVVVGNEANRRNLSGDDCSHLVDAAALILALDIDPEALTRHDNEPTNEPAPTATPTPSDGGVSPTVDGSPPAPTPTPRIDASANTAPKPAVVPSPVVATTPARTRTRFGLSAGARAVLDVGSLPRTTGGIGAILTMTYGHFAFELQGTAYERQFTVDGPRNGRAGAWVDLATASAHGCYRTIMHQVGWLDWHACVGGELGRESTTGVNLLRSNDVAGLWSAASAVLVARALPRSRISPTAGANLVIPIGSPPVVVDNFGTLFDPSAVVLRFMLGLDVNFF